MQWKWLVGGQPAQAPALLGRLITHSEKIFGSAEQTLATISDRREKPRIPTAVSLEAVLAVF